MVVDETKLSKSDKDKDKLIYMLARVDVLPVVHLVVVLPNKSRRNPERIMKQSVLPFRIQLQRDFTNIWARRQTA